MSKFSIEISPDKCTGCLRCQLACSELYFKVFNPSVARIQVIMRGADCDISFTSDCNGCGTCVQHCFYDALVKKTMKENAT